MTLVRVRVCWGLSDRGRGEGVCVIFFYFVLQIVFVNVCIEHVYIVMYIYMYMYIIYKVNYYYVLDVMHSHINCQVNYCDEISTLLAEF